MNTSKRVRMKRRERGAELVELALVLPILALLAAGVVDFANGWRTRQILANAARDGARLGASTSYLDLTYSNPNSIQTICQQVANYLIQAGLNPAFMGISGTTASAVTTGCSTPGTVGGTSSTVPSAYTYYVTYSTGTYGLKIEPMAKIPSGCGGIGDACIPSTRITLTYPYTWTTMGSSFFSSGTNSTIPIQVYSTMPNL
jgi:Flp pilus assembly protein TadG